MKNLALRHPCRASVIDMCVVTKWCCTACEMFHLFQGTMYVKLFFLFFSATCFFLLPQVFLFITTVHVIFFQNLIVCLLFFVRQKSGRKAGRNSFYLLYEKKAFNGRKSAVNRHRSRSAETVTICVSQKWCRILPRGISAVCIVLVVFLRFFYRKPET